MKSFSGFTPTDNLYMHNQKYIKKAKRYAGSVHKEKLPLSD